MRERAFIHKALVALVKFERLLPVNDSIVGTVPTQRLKLRKYVYVDLHHHSLKQHITYW